MENVTCNLLIKFPKRETAAARSSDKCTGQPLTPSATTLTHRRRRPCVPPHRETKYQVCVPSTLLIVGICFFVFVVLYR